jgi:hypothetical protein
MVISNKKNENIYFYVLIFVVKIPKCISTLSAQENFTAQVE